MYVSKGTAPAMIKIGKWDNRALKKALKGIEENSHDYSLLSQLLQPDPNKRLSSMKNVLAHAYFDED